MLGLALSRSSVYILFDIVSKVTAKEAFLDFLACAGKCLKTNYWVLAPLNALLLPVIGARPPSITTQIGSVSHCANF